MLNRQQEVTSILYESISIRARQLDFDLTLTLAHLDHQIQLGKTHELLEAAPGSVHQVGCWFLCLKPAFSRFG